MLNLRKTFISLMLPIVLFTASCSKDEQTVSPSVDNESLTTATLQLTNKTDALDVVTATVDKLNSTPDFSLDTLNLKANTIYTARIILLDKTKTPATNVTAEIKERANIHLFVYKPDTGLNLSVSITDKDTNTPPLPVGIESEFTTGAVSSGKLNLVLRHQPNAKNGTPEPGSSDLDTDFVVIIK